MLVVPSIGAKRHAEKVLDWGVDAVLVQGGEGGGHTGSVPTSILLPQVVDTVAGRVPVIAAGGFFDGRGLVAALAYGADAIAMGTRFLLTSDSSVPQAVKDFYLGKGVTDTVVTVQVDGVPHRVLRTDLVDRLESGRGKVSALPRAAVNALRFRKLTGTSLRSMLREGRAMRTSMDLSWSQMVMAANTPMLLRASLVEGKTESGVMASGQVVGIIDDLPSCRELVDRILNEAEATLKDLLDVGGRMNVLDGPDELRAARRNAVRARRVAGHHRRPHHGFRRGHRQRRSGLPARGTVEPARAEPREGHRIRDGRQLRHRGDPLRPARRRPATACVPPSTSRPSTRSTAGCRRRCSSPSRSTARTNRPAPIESLSRWML